MMDINDKIKALSVKVNANQPVKIAITGLGSVGNYLLSYLLSLNHKIEIHVIGRSKEKMLPDVNIALVAANIRKCPGIKITIHEVDLNNIAQLTETFATIQPDIVVNSSRAYSHIKYGVISWHTVRAYGIWCPLSVKYIKNIMSALSQTSAIPIVINTSYSDAVNAWIKTSGAIYPDFGSGNLNHLIPRIRFAVAKQLQVDNVTDIDITLATSHFHDVLISKEGKTELIDPLIKILYQGKDLSFDMNAIYAQCAISMPTDAKRNMMNASSNFDIIASILDSVKEKQIKKLHVPGAMGLLGGYPVVVNGNLHTACIDETFFSLSEMQSVNALSIYKDGIENVMNGTLVYTDELIDKVKQHFQYSLPKKVNLKDSDSIADELIKNIIEYNP